MIMVFIYWVTMNINFAFKSNNVKSIEIRYVKIVKWFSDKILLNDKIWNDEEILLSILKIQVYAIERKRIKYMCILVNKPYVENKSNGFFFLLNIFSIEFLRYFQCLVLTKTFYIGDQTLYNQVNSNGICHVLVDSLNKILHHVAITISQNRLKKTWFILFFSDVNDYFWMIMFEYNQKKNTNYTPQGFSPSFFLLHHSMM
jgi:hypothetical protein